MACMYIPTLTVRARLPFAYRAAGMPCRIHVVGVTRRSVWMARGSQLQAQLLGRPQHSNQALKHARHDS